ncbi:MAG: Hercynine oxygenase [bacterium]|nr:Hercynine oxygenase [bacterium]
MDEFTIGYLAELTASLTEKLLGKLRDSIVGPEKEQAIRRCLHTAMEALMATAKTKSRDKQNLLETIFRKFFAKAAVGKEVGALLNGHSLNRKKLLELFKQAGFNARKLPGVDFKEAISAFEQAFLSAATEEPALQGTIQTNQLLAQTKLLGEIRDSTRAKTPAAKALRESYLNHLFESSRQLSLSGIDPNVASKAETRLQLDGIYTALLTLAPEMLERLERSAMPEKETRRLSALEQLNRQNRLVLLGDPGSGKSTFVNFVALCFAGEMLRRQEANLRLLTAPLPSQKEDDEKQKRRQPWQHGALLPVRIILRDFAARGLPEAGKKVSAEHLWNFIVAELEPATLGDFAPHLKNELREKGGLLLLDGLDEVPEAQQRRMQIKQAVEDFAACFPHCRMLVTSRTYAYQKQDWRLPSFAEAVLAPFSAGQIRSFVEHWYSHIAASRGWHRDDAQGRAELLKRAIFGSKNLQALAERPLLLTLMASLHAWRGGSLPEKREQLYADTVDLLLDWWESPKTVRDAKGEIKVLQPSLAEWLKVDKQKVRELLNESAYFAHSAQPDLQGTADIAESELVQKLIRLSPDPDMKPARLVEFLSQRAGLLLPRGEGVYTFPHRTFQEYLAACYLTDHDYPDKLAELAKTDPNRWREVALLAAAKASRGSDFAVWALVDSLCYDAPEKAQTNLTEIWGGHLAGQTLVESANLSRVSARNKARVELVQKWLTHILRREDFPATERALAGNSLAYLGDPRFRADAWFLPDEPLLGFVEIPAGEFLMGSDKEKDSQAWDNELKQHKLTLPRYYIARYPVTVAQFQSFVNESNYKPEDPESLNGLPNHPVVNVTWHEALAYCEWLTERLRNWKETPEPLASLLKKQDWRITLPSEAEWEKAARGADGRIYPWGNEADANRANYSDTGIGATSAVGCFPGGASPYGCEEMSGNVLEWTRSLWEDYPYPTDAKERAKRENLEAPRDKGRVVRGGAFSGSVWHVRCACRVRFYPYYWFINLGFRVAATPVGCSHYSDL